MQNISERTIVGAKGYSQFETPNPRHVTMCDLRAWIVNSSTMKLPPIAACSQHQLKSINGYSAITNNANTTHRCLLATPGRLLEWIRMDGPLPLCTTRASHQRQGRQVKMIRAFSASISLARSLIGAPVALVLGLRLALALALALAFGLVLDFLLDLVLDDLDFAALAFGFAFLLGLYGGSNQLSVSQDALEHNLIFF